MSLCKSIRILFLFLAYLGGTSCDKLSMKDAEQEGAVSFDGIKSITRAVDGKYVLKWDYPDDNLRGTSFEIYLQKSERVVDSEPDSSLDAVNEEESLAGSKIVKLTDDQAPITQGALINTAQGVRSYTLDFVPQTSITYAFQIRSHGGDGTDLNQSVLIYTPEEVRLNFSGIKDGSITQAGKILLSWDPPKELSGLSSSDIRYEVYMDVTPEPLAASLTGALAIGTNLNSNVTNASLWEFPEERLPSKLTTPLAQVEGKRFFQVEEDLIEGNTYIFQVKSMGPNSETDSNSRVFVYRMGLENLEPFVGISSLTSENHGTVNIGWEKSDNGDVAGYNIYQGSNFRELLVSVDKEINSYKKTNLLPGELLTFGVRAYDKYGSEDSNNKTLSIEVLNNEVPIFAGLTVASLQNQNEVKLSWQPASGQPKQYNIYQGVTATGAGASVDTSTPMTIVDAPATTTTIKGLGDDQDYHFMVRAAVAGGAEDQNTVIKTISIPDLGAPAFSGIQTLSLASGGIKVGWDKATGQVSNYKIYASETSPLQFSPATFKKSVGADLLNTTLTGLADNRTWYIGVRAIDLHSQEDTNGISKSINVSDLTPPLFLGFDGAGASSVASDEDKLDVFFKRSTESDINYYSIQVRKSGSSSFIEKYQYPQPASGNISYRITGLEGNTTYDILVKAVDTSGNISTSETTVSATTVDLTPPSFAGIKDVTRDTNATPLYVDAEWDAPVSGDATSYRLYYSKDSFSTESFSKENSFPLTVNGKTIHMVLIPSGNTLKESLKIIDDLDESSTYYFMVRATDVAGNEDQNTSQISFVVPVVTPPVFSGVESAILEAGTLNVNLTWTPPVSSNPAASYLIYYSTSSASPRTWTGPINVQAPATGYKVTGLSEMQTYHFKVYAKNVQGITDENVIEKSADVLDITPPVFSGLTSIENDGPNEAIKLKFSPATDSQEVKEYRVYWKEYPSGSYQDLGSPGKTVSHIDACAATCEISLLQSDGLVPEITYEFRVDAADINIPTNTKMNDSKVIHQFPNFSPPPAPTATKSPEPVGVTNNLSYTVSGTGTDGMQIRAYCYNIDTATLLDLATCGNSTTLSGTTSYSIPVTLPDTTNSYQIKVVQYNTQNSKESSSSNAGAAVTLDRTAPTLEAFTGCASGLCQDITTIGTETAKVNKAIISFLANEAGNYAIKKGSNVIKSGVLPAASIVKVNLNANDLNNAEGSHALKVFFIDAAGNVSAGDGFNLTLDLTSPSLNIGSFKVTKVIADDDYKLAWSNAGLAPTDTMMIRKLAGATPPGQTNGALIVSDMDKATESYLVSGANSESLPQSFSLFACDVVGNCTRAPMTLDGGISNFQVRSEGSVANYSWDIESGGDTPKLAHSQIKNTLELWDGVSNLGDPVLVSSGTDGCMSHTSGCSIDYSTLLPWEKRFLRVAVPSSDGKGVTFSPIQVFARVPDGMVYIDKDVWPNEEGMTYAEHEKFSFAIDKYEASLASGTLNGSANLSSGGDGILQSVENVTPLTSKNWYAYKRGCQNRSALESDFVGSHPSRQIRMMTGVEFIVAAYGTLDQGGAGYCNIDDRGAPAAPNATGTDDNSKCSSLFGLRNLIGNQWEWTDELLDNRNFIRFYGESSNQIETIAAPIFSETNGNISIKNFDPATAFPEIGSRNGPWQGKYDNIWQSWGSTNAMPIEARAKAALRGGSWYHWSANAGRFALNLDYAPTLALTHAGGRCALLPPTPANLRFRSNSDGSHARFNWRMWGEATGTTVRLGLAKTKADLDAWTGNANGAVLTDNLYTIENFSDCTDSSYNSEGFEIPGTGSTTSGALSLQGRCGIDISGLAPWEKRYVKMYAGNSFGEVFSEMLVVARVPDGMVFVSADDWPDEAKHRLAAEYGESYTAPFDFAIDKYEVSANGSIANCTGQDFPCSTDEVVGYLESTGATPPVNLDWYTYKQGCDNRTAVLGGTWADQGTTDPDDYQSGRRVHLATGIEWMVASFETPDAIGPQFCSTNSTFWNPGSPANQIQTGTNSMERCQSRYGARNMIGNQWEWTDDLGHDGLMRRYWTQASDGIDTGLSLSWNVAEGNVGSWNFELGFPLSSTSGDSSFSQADYYYENSGLLSSFGLEARAALRGGSWTDGTNAGRFALNLDNAPSYARTHIGGRCALLPPP